MIVTATALSVQISLGLEEAAGHASLTLSYNTSMSSQYRSDIFLA